MRRISSKMTFFYKRIFPAVWFGFLTLLFLVIAIPLFFGGAQHDPPPYPLLVVPLIMIGFGYFVMKKLVFDLVDEVWEDGDSLVVKNRGQESHIALSDIKNVSYAPLINPVLWRERQARQFPREPPRPPPGPQSEWQAQGGRGGPRARQQ